MIRERNWCRFRAQLFSANRPDDQLKKNRLTSNKWSDQTDKLGVFDMWNCGSFAFFTCTNILLNHSRRQSQNYTGLNFQLKHALLSIDGSMTVVSAGVVRRWTDSIFVLVFNGHNIYFQIATTYKSGSWLVLSYLKLFLITHFHLHVNKTWWSYFCVVNYLYFLIFKWNSILHLVQRAFSLIGPSEWKK